MGNTLRLGDIIRLRHTNYIFMITAILEDRYNCIGIEKCSNDRAFLFKENVDRVEKIGNIFEGEKHDKQRKTKKS